MKIKLLFEYNFTWKCSCGGINFYTSLYCEHCGGTRSGEN